MSQSSITLTCSQTGTSYTTNLNTALSSLDSMHSGTTAPTANLVDGKMWLDNSSSDNVIKMLIGATWYPLLDFNGSEFLTTGQSAIKATADSALSKANVNATALNSKVDDSQVLTNVPTGAKFTDTTYSLPSSVVHDSESGALHATDALRISGHTVSLYKGNGTSESVTIPDNNTTYTVGNGGLTEVNFTTADNNKLDGIASGANSYSLPSSVVHDTESSALHATDALRISGHTVSLYKGNGTSESVTIPDNNTTYSVGNGGLTQVNFTTTDNSKLDGIETGAVKNYNNLTNKPAIPTNNNQLTNGRGYITSAPVTSVNGSTGAVTVASGFSWPVNPSFSNKSQAYTGVITLSGGSGFYFYSQTSGSNPLGTSNGITNGSTGIFYQGSGGLSLRTIGSAAVNYIKLG